jgi:hypothetical protein
MSETRPFHVAVPEERLAAIRRRVQQFPWDDMPVLAEDGDPWSAGASHSFMRELCDYWVNQFDWRAQEVAINRLPQMMARVDGQDIHVLHERGSGPRDAALVLTHGWPGSIVEFLHLIERFAHPERFGGSADDGIDVVVPALPGFGFSGRPAAPFGPRKIAGLWDRLLREVLGYERYIAQGGDWGSMVSAMAGLDHSLARGGGCRWIETRPGRGAPLALPGPPAPASFGVLLCRRRSTGRSPKMATWRSPGDGKSLHDRQP